MVAETVTGVLGSTEVCWSASNTGTFAVNDRGAVAPAEQTEYLLCTPTPSWVETPNWINTVAGQVTFAIDKLSGTSNRGVRLVIGSAAILTTCGRELTAFDAAGIEDAELPIVVVRPADELLVDG